MVKYYLLIIIVIYFLGGCGYIAPNHEYLTFNRREYEGNDFRIDGYYYEIFESEWQGKPQTMYSIMFFFRNGVTLIGDFPTTQELPEEEESYKDGSYYENEKNNKLKWGVFRVEGDKIYREIWSNPNGAYLVTKQRLSIINDTTIKFESSERIDGSNSKLLSSTYHFKHFSPKPDSVVDFIP